MRFLRSSYPWLLAIVSCACGTRSSLEGIADYGSIMSGGRASGGSGSSVGGESSTGGKSTGGENPWSGGGSGGFFSSGGTVSGGSSSGGFSQAGGAPGSGGAPPPTGGAMNPCSFGTFDADPGPNQECKAWSDCEPGTSVGFAGDSIFDRTCNDCSPGYYSTEINSNYCEYGGCEFYENLVTEGTPTTPSDCIRDPHIHFIESDEYLYASGFAASATTAHLATLTVSNELQIRSFRDDVVLDTITPAFSARASIQQFDVADDRTFFLATLNSYAQESNVLAIQSNGDPFWNAARPWDYYAADDGAGLAVSDSHVVSWGFASQIDDYSISLPLNLRKLDGTDPRTSDVELNVTSFRGAVMDHNEGLWFSGSNYNEVQLIRLDSIDAAPEVATLSNMGYQSSFITTVPDGRGYAALLDGDVVIVSEFDTNAILVRSWTVSIPVTSSTAIVGIRVLPDEAIFIAGNFGSYSYPETTILDVFAIRLDMQDGTAEFKSFVGPYVDQTFAMDLAGDGQLYLAGISNFDSQVYRQAYYVRRAF
jgi:hypothetical protein